jgi:hypothetical protein
LENWTVEANGLGDFNLTGTGNKWDLAVLDNYIYLFGGTGASSCMCCYQYDNGSWETLPPEWSQLQHQITHLKAQWLLM